MKSSVPQSVNDYTPFTDKQWDFKTDQNQGVYGTNSGMTQVTFDLNNMFDSSSFVDISDMYLTIPVIMSAAFSAGAGVVAGADVSGAPAQTPSETTKRPVNLYAGASLSTPLKALTWGVSYDYLFNPYNTESGRTGFYTAPTRAGLSSYANAFAVYASYQLSEKAKLNLRGEYATSSGGVFLPAAAGFANDEKLTGATATLDYSLWANVVTRLEVRWDHIAGGTVQRPFNDNRNDVSVAANVIYKF
jgi:hypothetical protein